MKKIVLAMVALMTISLSACSQSNKQKENKEMGKSIVVFFSHAGDNYAVGNIEVGNTKIVADYITEIIGADLRRPHIPVVRRSLPLPLPD